MIAVPFNNRVFEISDCRSIAAKSTLTGHKFILKLTEIAIIKNKSFKLIPSY